MHENVNRIRDRVRALVRRAPEELGAVATEYGLTLLLISLAIIVAAAAFGVILAGLDDQGTAGVAPIAGSGP